jgi:hypothetical protein
MENGNVLETPLRQRFLHGPRMTMAAVKDSFPDEQQTNEPPSVVSAAATEPTAHASNSCSPCSQSHSTWDSSGYMRKNVQSSCFLCILRSEENEELEKKILLLQKTQTTLEEAIAQLTEDGEVNAAQFETLSSLYHTDKRSLQEQLKISDEIRKSLESKYNQIDRENLSLRAQLEKADAKIENLKTHNQEMEKEVSEYEALSAVSHTDRQDLHDRIRNLEVEKTNWISSWSVVVREKEVLDRRLKYFEQGDMDNGSKIHNDSENVYIPTSSDFNVNTALLNKIMEEKDLLEGELYRITKRNCELEAKQCELEKLLLSHQRESHVTTPENETDTVSALTHEESPLHEARFKLLEEENSFLQRSLHFLKEENRIYEDRLQESEAKIARQYTMHQIEFMAERNLLQDRITELLQEKSDVVCCYENALSAAKLENTKKDKLIKESKVELDKKKLELDQINSDVHRKQVEIERLSSLAEIRLTEKAALEAKLLSAENTLQQQNERFEKSINALEAQLELYVLLDAHTQAQNVELTKEVSRLSSVLANQPNLELLQEWVEQMKRETNYYQDMAEQFERELNLLHELMPEHFSH